MSLYFLGIDFLVFIAILYDERLRRRLPTRQSLLFTLCVFAQLYVIIFDNVSMFINGRYQQVPHLLLDIFNALFYLGFMFRGFIFFSYSLELLQKRGRIKKAFMLFAVTILLVEGILILSDIMGNMFFFVDDKGYHTGHEVYYIYIGALIYNFMGYMLFFKNRKKLLFSKLQRIFFFLYLTVRLFGTVARFFEPRTAGLGMAGICAVAFVYIAFENPNIHMTEGGIFYNEESLYRVTSEWSERGKYYLFAFSISRYMENMEIYGHQRMREAIWEIGNFLKAELPELYVFSAEGRFVLLSRDEMDYEELSVKLSERFQKAWHTSSSSIYLIPVFAAFDSTLGRYMGVETVQILQFVLKKREHAIEGMPQITITKEEFDKLNREIYIRQVMNHAADDNLVRMFLQPIIDAKTGEVCGAEALMRLVDKDGNYIAPNEFIPLAEKNGKILDLGRVIYTEVCRFYKMHGGKQAMKWINVNLSPVQCLVPSLPEELRDIAQEINVDPAKIHLEITEEAFIEVPKLLSAMEAIQKNGYTFALDDYGSGYSNISRIKELPFTNVKLDKSIVWNHFKDSDELLPLTIKSLKSLNYTITAEGVETKEMAEHLAEMGVDYLQGFYFGKPLPESEFIQQYL